MSTTIPHRLYCTFHGGDTFKTQDNHNYTCNVMIHHLHAHARAQITLHTHFFYSIELTFTQHHWTDATHIQGALYCEPNHIKSFSSKVPREEFSPSLFANVSLKKPDIERTHAHQFLTPTPSCPSDLHLDDNTHYRNINNNQNGKYDTTYTHNTSTFAKLLSRTTTVWTFCSHLQKI